jgi:hypothetical protein
MVYGIVYPHDKEWNNMFILEHSLLFSEQALFIYSWLQMILLFPFRTIPIYYSW